MRSKVNIISERKKKMKKFLAIALLLAMCVGSFMFVGCDSNGGHEVRTDRPSDNTNTEPLKYDVPDVGYDGSEVTITFSHTMSATTLQPVLTKYIAKFNEMYPNIHVEHTAPGGYDELRDQIKTELTAGNQPNIAYCYPDHVALYNVAKAVVPLNSLIESKIEVTDAKGNKTVLGLTDEQIDDFIPGYYAEGAVYDTAGTMYTLPMSKSTEVLYYNKTFFEEHNLKVPTTWDEMETVCAQIREIVKDYDNAKTIKPLGYDSEANWFITLCEQYGSPYTSSVKGKEFLFNNDKNKEFIKELRKWYEASYFTTQDLNGGYTSSLFKEQTSFMSIGSSAGASNQRPTQVDNEYPFDVGIVPIPQVDSSNPKAISQGPSLCIFDSDNKQEVIASWLFVKFLTTDKEFQAEFSMVSGYMPVIKSVDEVPAYANYLEKADGGANITALAVKVGREMADYYFVSPAFNGSSAARDKVGALLQYCITADATNGVDAMVDQAFLDAIKECNAAL